jgi:hypothetical protein
MGTCFYCWAAAKALLVEIGRKIISVHGQETARLKRPAAFDGVLCCH